MRPIDTQKRSHVTQKRSNVTHKRDFFYNLIHPCTAIPCCPRISDSVQVSVLQCVAVRCSSLQFVAMCCSVLHCVEVSS